MVTAVIVTLCVLLCVAHVYIGVLSARLKVTTELLAAVGEPPQPPIGAYGYCDATGTFHRLRCDADGYVLTCPETQLDTHGRVIPSRAE